MNRLTKQIPRIIHAQCKARLVSTTGPPFQRRFTPFYLRISRKLRKKPNKLLNMSMLCFDLVKHICHREFFVYYHFLEAMD